MFLYYSKKKILFFLPVFRAFEGEMNAVMKELSTIEDLRNTENAFDDEEPYINLEILQEKTLFTKGPRVLKFLFLLLITVNRLLFHS